LIEEFIGEAKHLSLSQLTSVLINQTGYLQRLKEEGTEKAFTRMENIDELIHAMKDMEQGGEGEEGASLETFLEKVSLMTDVDLYEDKGNRVSLMTLHCAKGLEFPMVFIVGMEEGLLPHYRREDEMEDLEEERRLCYVGITRAKEKLFLSRAEKRSTFGIGRANFPSRFLEEIPMELIQLEEREGRAEDFIVQESRWDFPVSGNEYSFPQRHFPAEDGIALIAEGFFPLRIGMKVRHPKFGEGWVKSVEGMDENQKATILFQSLGTKRLKVKYANLEILE
jgi:DNA helicase-2/ATP-dependent DNA helicase PcrA